MANRFRNRYYERGDYGNRSDFGRERYGSDYDNERNSGYSPRFGGYDYDREENYFGGGNMSYGQGYTGTGFDRGYSSYNRDFEEDNMRFNRPSRSYTGFSGRSYRGGGDRDDYFSGRYRDEDDYSRGTYGGYYGRSDYGYDRDHDSGYYTKNRYGNDRSYGSEYSNDERFYDRRNRDRYGYDRGDDRGFFEKAGDEIASWFGDEEAERRRRMDARQNYRGRGPRNYTRSDDRIKEDINDRLTDDYYLDASDIDVEVNNCEVILKGTVDSRYAKRHAEDIAEDVSGVTHLENRLRVNDSSYFQNDSSLTNTADENLTTDTATTKSRSKTA